MSTPVGGHLNEWLGQWALVMMALTLVGVVYIILRLEKVNMNLSFSRSAEGYGSGNTQRWHGAVVDSGNMQQSTPHSRGHEGFSQSGGEAPVFHMTPYDPTQLNQLNQLGGVVDYGADDEGTGMVKLIPTHLRNQVPVEGMGSYSKASVRQGMTTQLDAALAGGMARLA